VSSGPKHFFHKSESANSVVSRGGKGISFSMVSTDAPAEGSHRDIYLPLILMGDYIYASSGVQATWNRGEQRGEWALTGRVVGLPGAQTLTLFAAAPADAMTTFSGSGLPFPREDFAPAQGPVEVPVGVDGSFALAVKEPNSFYDADGALHGPEVRLTVKRFGGATEEHVIALPPAARIPFRSLSYLRDMSSSAFNDDIVRFDARSQEAILRSREFTRKSEANRVRVYAPATPCTHHSTPCTHPPPPRASS